MRKVSTPSCATAIVGTDAAASNRDPANIIFLIVLSIVVSPCVGVSVFFLHLLKRKFQENLRSFRCTFHPRKKCRLRLGDKHRSDPCQWRQVRHIEVDARSKKKLLFGRG